MNVYEYAVDVFINTPESLAGIDIRITHLASEGWRVHKIWQTYRGTQIVVLYERMRIE